MDWYAYLKMLVGRSSLCRFIQIKLVTYKGAPQKVAPFFYLENLVKVKMNIKEQKAIINKAIGYILDIDGDVPQGEFFADFHTENTKLIKDLRRLRKSLNNNMRQ
jgi:hypothetical protein